MNTPPRTRLNHALWAVLLLLLTNSAHAQAVAAPAGSNPAIAADSSLPTTLIAWLTPVVVPLVLLGAKKLIPKLPGRALPLIAPVLGWLLGVIDNLAGAEQSNLWVAAGLGLLGVAVREVKESVAPAVNGGWPAQAPRPVQSDGPID